MFTVKIRLFELTYLNPRKPGDPCKYTFGVKSPSPIKFREEEYFYCLLKDSVSMLFVKKL